MRRFGLVIAAVVLSVPATAHAGVRTAALGHITLRSTDGLTVGYVVTGIYNTSAFDCGLNNPPGGAPYVECVDQQTDPLIDWDCTHFLVTATAPGTRQHRGGCRPWADRLRVCDRPRHQLCRVARLPHGR